MPQLDINIFLNIEIIVILTVFFFIISIFTVFEYQNILFCIFKKHIAISSRSSFMFGVEYFYVQNNKQQLSTYRKI